MVKFFSNFDTKAPTKNYAEAVQEFGFDKVVFLRRHKLYFYLYTVVPAVFSLLLSGFIILLFFWKPTSGSEIGLRRSYLLQIICLLIVIYLALLALARYFNYTLDYTIITPSYISAYDQQGIFNRKITTIEPGKIKTINFSSAGFINSLFNFGRIDILLEGDDKGNGEVIIDFIEDPEGVKSKIVRITDHITNPEIG